MIESFRASVFFALLAMGSLVQAQEAVPGAWAFSDWREGPEAAEEFLLTANAVHSEVLPVGITKPLRVTLEKNGVEARAAFKSVDIFRTKMEFEDGHVEFNFRDSFRSELAAYRLDQMLGTGLVPPTVERSIDGEAGALRLWVENSMTEQERRERNIGIVHQDQWNIDSSNTKVFFNLTGNTDLRNIANLLVDEQFRICAIDHSRAFTTSKQLVGEEQMFTFSREMLEKIEALDRKTLLDELGEWLSPGQIKSLLKRRDLILSRAEKMIELKGEDVVLLP